MPRTVTTGSANIKIDLASPPGWTYIAGDTIIGNVVRRLHIVTPEASVTLALVGRVKTKITVKRRNNNGTSTSHYRGRWDLLGNTTRQILFQGPLHLAPDSASDGLIWSFSLDIPAQPTDEVLRGHNKAESFLPLNQDHNLHHVLPGTFYSNSRGWRTSSEGFVEYYLEAELRYSRGGSFEIQKATMPITMRPPAAGIPSSYELQQWVEEKRIRSQRLLPGMEHAELSLKQKTQKLFGSSKVPEFRCMVEVSWPKAIQLDNPSPIPLIIGIVPSHTSPEISDVAHKVQLNGINLNIRATTLVLAPSNFSTSSAHDDIHSSRHHLGLARVFQQLQQPIMFSTGKGNEPIDIGNMLGLTLRSDGMTAGGQHLTAGWNLYPDFVTYNIKHGHSLELEASFTVAEETLTVKMSSGLTILAAG
ncbi:hypothetical protein BBP40_010358 [Aspergillus hancockii]|nr:hypothetical protein BBP40_010358 [Aspergillus hancockii]